MTNYLSLPGIESGQAGSQDMGLSVLKLAKSQTNQDEAVGHPRELPCPSCYGPWFPVLIFLLFKHLSGSKFPVQHLSQHKGQKEHIREMNEQIISPWPQGTNAESKQRWLASTHGRGVWERRGCWLFSREAGALT